MPDMTLNREGIRTLLGHGSTMQELGERFHISRGWLRQYLEGREPQHPGVTAYINYHTKLLLQELK
jgi:transcriptional regulator with XRE-family HTH domain